MAAPKMFINQKKIMRAKFFLKPINVWSMKKRVGGKIVLEIIGMWTCYLLKTLE